MNKLFFGLIVTAFTAVHAGEGFYIGAQGGVNFLQSHFLKSRHCTFDTGYNLGVFGGYGWCNGLSLEAEATYRNNDYDLHGTNESGVGTTFHGNVHTWSFMGNGYYAIAFPSCWNLAPYFGAGIGCDNVHQRIKIIGENFRGSHTGFAWQLMAGLDYFFCEDVVLAAEYKFHVSPLRHDHHMENNSVTLGLRKSF